MWSTLNQLCACLCHCIPYHCCFSSTHLAMGYMLLLTTVPPMLIAVPKPHWWLGAAMLLLRLAGLKSAWWLEHYSSSALAMRVWAAGCCHDTIGWPFGAHDISEQKSQLCAHCKAYVHIKNLVSFTISPECWYWSAIDEGTSAIGTVHLCNITKAVTECLYGGLATLFTHSQETVLTCCVCSCEHVSKMLSHWTDQGTSNLVPKHSWKMPALSTSELNKMPCWGSWFTV